MKECGRCSRTEDEVRLFNAIYENEEILCCERCSLIDNIILLKVPSTTQLVSSEKSESVTKRLRRMGNFEDGEKKSESVYDELRKLEESPELERPEKEDERLVENFHWSIQHGRRMKKLSQEQLAENLGESEMAIKIIESGELPEDCGKLIRKLEQFLQIKLRKERLERVEKKGPKFLPISSVVKDEPEDEIIELPKDVKEELMVEAVERAKEREKNIVKKVESRKPIRILDFKARDVDNVTISDLRKMKEKEKIDEGEKRRIRERVKKEMIREAKRDEMIVEGKKELDYSQKTPSIADLIERKKIRDADNLVGDEIEIEEVDKD